MDAGVGVVIAVAVTGGLIAGMIGAPKQPGKQGAAFVGFFILGALLPLIGVVVALLAKGPTAAPQPPGWYPDPWQQAAQRYYDGAHWTYHLARARPRQC